MYKLIINVCKGLILLLNGHLQVHGKERLPEDNYILIAPHRTWWEAVLFAVAAYPREFTFMAKKELFKNPIFAWIIKQAHAFPVDRENPSPSVLKHPIKQLKNGDLSLMIFPSGTRHSSQLKGGAIAIARLTKKPVVPVVYQGPLSFKDVLKRKPLKVQFGEPIELDLKKKVSKEEEQVIFQEFEHAWDKLDQELDPNFKYVAK
ncbi:MAG: 1-acyl-sn-glycerol-3-phosphate acyltransferase [Lactobacillus sp.]|nr:1-acyl-sn-glycerol-3-phosphate acyltransferase [Lactobacillus sp.]